MLTDELQWTWQSPRSEGAVMNQPGAPFLREVVRYIREKKSEGVMDFESILSHVETRLLQHAREIEKAIDARSRRVDKRRETLSGMENHIVERVGRVIATVSTHYRVPEAAIIGHRKTRQIVQIRVAVAWLARQWCPDLTYTDIALVMLRDHSTIVYGIALAERYRNENPRYRQELDAMLEQLRQS